MINIAILGHGVVGSGVVEVLLHNSESISKKSKEVINVKRILDLREFPDSPLADRFTTNFDDIINDDEISIVVECMGGINPAYEFVKKCLLKGKSVVTSNKELVATCGQELLEIASQNNLNFLFEASVGGGIPIIRPISQCLAANEFSEIIGILNGTTNFILTKMINDNMSFEQALSLAQQKGYAERDPSADVDGHDTCRKICILASLAFGKHVSPKYVHTEGIRNITLKDVEYAEKWGSVIKLLGIVKKDNNDQINCTVYPCVVPKYSQLSSVDDVFNAIMVRGDVIGDVMFYGRGAGKLPTASAVVADVIDCVKHMKARKYLYWGEETDNYVIDHMNCECELFVRIVADNSQNVINDLKENLDIVKVINDENSNEFCVVVKGVEKDILEQLKDSNFTVESILHVLD